jgi:hypothetical protein
MKKIFSRKSQSLTETALILATVGLVFVGMEVYIRRGVQARIKDLSDNMIGKEHSIYASDVSGLSVLTSGTEEDPNVTTVDSTATTTTTAGGARQTTKGESITATSTTHSVYVPD